MGSDQLVPPHRFPEVESWQRLQMPSWDSFVRVSVLDESCRGAGLSLTEWTPSYKEKEGAVTTQDICACLLQREEERRWKIVTALATQFLVAVLLLASCGSCLCSC